MITTVVLVVLGLAVLGLGQELALLEGRLARIDDDVILVIDDALKLAAGQVQHEADARGHALVEPDVGDRHRELNVAHALAAHAAEGHLDAAAVADDALVADALVLAAVALPVLGGTEDALAEEEIGRASCRERV